MGTEMGVEPWEIRRARYLAEKEHPPDPATVVKKRKIWRHRGPWKLNPAEQQMNERAMDSLDQAEKLRSRQW